MIGGEEEVPGEGGTALLIRACCACGGEGVWVGGLGRGLRHLGRGEPSSDIFNHSSLVLMAKKEICFRVEGRMHAAVTNNLPVAISGLARSSGICHKGISRL